MKVILSGANGKMGKVLTEVIKETEGWEVVFGIDSYVPNGDDHITFNKSSVPFPIFPGVNKITEEISADILIDFSHFSLTNDILKYCESKNLPIVIATTALSDETKTLIKNLSTKIPIFHSSNMSLGINMLIKALRAIAPALEENFNVEIIEKHHNMKIDAPSGTAFMIADEINETLQEKKDYIFGRRGVKNENKISEIGIHALRGGTLPGEHEVLFMGEDEVIELKHTAYSRKIFAKGAITAANFLIKQEPGLYDFFGM